MLRVIRSIAGDVFQLVEDIVDTNRIEDVKACFSFMDGYWAQLREKSLKLSSATLLRFQKACNMFTRRVSNNQDAEILGAVSFQVAKMLPYNDTAGLNKPFNANDSHKTPMDEEIGVRLCTLIAESGVHTTEQVIAEDAFMLCD